MLAAMVVVTGPLPLDEYIAVGIMQTMKPKIFVIDVGAPHKGNLGWANADGSSGADIDQCIEAVNKALPVAPVALGFEAPMYVPVRVDPNTLLKARVFEGNRPWSAGAGPTVMSQGLVIMSYVFERLIDGVRPRFDAPQQPMDLQVFEAMVSGAGKPELAGHVADALAAANAYDEGKFYEESSDVLNLAAAALQWSGYEADVRSTVFVVKTG
jgi:hypothetical protein